MIKVDQTIAELEKTLNIDFNDKKLIITALTHSSYANQKIYIEYNERLEFLGDSVLQLVISEYVFFKLLNKAEGDLTKIRSLIVCESSLHSLALKWKLGHYIFMSKGEEMSGGRNRTSILADCVESIIAAVYIDKGLEVSKNFILTNFDEIINKSIRNEIVFDYKTKLQEIMQKNGSIDIDYKITKFEGPPHMRKFYIEVIIGSKVLGTGSGFSKKAAEQAAAKIALKNMGL